MKHMHPVVSVIVPVYNAAAFLRQTLDCICGQTLKEIEIILVDDGSTDETPAILQEYAARDSRIILLQQEHEYAGAARNKGMAIARGKYYSFLDADDLFEPTMLEKMVARAEEVGADVVVCRCDIFYKEGEYTPLNWQIQDRYLTDLNRKKFSLKKEYPQAVFKSFVGWPWDKLFRAEYVKEHGFSFGPTRHGNDGPFVFPAIAGADCISIIDESLVKYRKSDTQISNASNVAKNPTAGCTSVEHIAEALQKMDIPDGAWLAFTTWVAHYMCWNMNKLAPETEAREELRAYIRETFDAQFQVSRRLKQYSQEPAGAEVFKALKKDIKQYMAIISPDISVVLPIYNAGPYLREALDSLLAQTFDNFEAICVNDGSTDNSLAILREYAAKDIRIRILDGPNGGYGKAMNRGMNEVTGKYFAILEPDDVLPKDAYEKLFKLAETHHLDIVKGCVSRFVDEKGKRNFYETTQFAKEDLHMVFTPRQRLSVFSVNMNTWTCLYRMDFLRAHKIMHHETPGAQYQDNGLFFLSFSYADRVMFIPDVVYNCRRDNPNSSVHALARRPYSMRNEYAYIRARLEETPDIWNIVQPAYVFKRWIAHLNTFNKLPNGIKMEYLQDLRAEMLEFELTDLSLLKPQHKADYLNLMISPEYMLYQTSIKALLEQHVVKKFGLLLKTQSQDNSSTLKKISQSPEQQNIKLHDATFSKNDVIIWKGIPLWQIRKHGYKVSFYLFGILPIWSKNIKKGRLIHRILGIRVKHTRVSPK